MNIKKYLIGAGLSAAILTGVATIALAHEAKGRVPGERDDEMEIKIKDGIEKAGKAGTQMILQVGPGGNVLMRGIIDSIATTTPEDSIIVKTWGGNWNVNVPSTANVMPTSDLSQFKVGDLIGVLGTINQSKAFTVDARIVKDWSLRKEVQESKDSINPKNWQGTVSNMNAAGSTFTLTVDGTAYTANVVAGAKIVNKNYATITLANISNGDTVRVWATKSDTTLTAYIVRDVSVQ